MSFIFKKPEDSPGFLLWQLTNEWQRKQRKALEVLHLTHPQFVVLAALLWLGNAEKDITQQQLSDLTKIDKMTMSDVVKLLLKKKMIQRLPHPIDKRAQSLMLTTKGKSLVLKAIPIVEEIDLQFFTSKNTNVKHLARYLTRAL